MDPTFVPSAIPPLALGFFGLGTGYLIYGPYELLKWPPREGGVAESLGTWGIWLAGFCQFVCGSMLFLGLTFFRVLRTVAGRSPARNESGLHGRPRVQRIRHPLVCHGVEPCRRSRPTSERRHVRCLHGPLGLPRTAG